MRRSNLKKPVLYINPIGGLANRMRALAGGIALARDLNVDYRVIWLRNWELNAAFEDVFELPVELAGKISYPGAIEYGLLYSPPRKKNLKVSSISLRRYGCSFLDSFSTCADILNDEDSDNVIRKMFEIGFSGRSICFIQGGRPLYSFDLDFYRHIFKPSQSVMDSVEKRLYGLNMDIYGVHVRRTDNQESIKHSPDYVFIEEMRKMVRENPNISFYLSTDSEEVKKRLNEEFGERIRHSTEVARRDTLEGMQEAAVELFTLASTKEILGSYHSSFSEAAAMLGNIPLRKLMI